MYTRRTVSDQFNSIFGVNWKMHLFYLIDQLLDLSVNSGFDIWSAYGMCSVEDY